MLAAIALDGAMVGVSTIDLPTVTFAVGRRETPVGAGRTFTVQVAFLPL